MSTQTSQLPDTRERARSFKRAVKKPFEVWYRSKNGMTWFKEWRRFGRYKDNETAQMVLQQKSGDAYFEYEIRVRS